MRARLRPAYSPAELETVYPRPHDHTRFVDHQARVDRTLEMALGVAAQSAADLSCGNGYVLHHLPAPTKLFGDFALHHEYQYAGPIEQTIEEIPAVDLFICGETIEHLDDPDAVLAQIRRKCGTLVLSTPIGAHDDDNPEHYWSWDREDVEAMLHIAGFDKLAFTSVDTRPDGYPYCFGIWRAQ